MLDSEGNILRTSNTPVQALLFLGSEQLEGGIMGATTVICRGGVAVFSDLAITLAQTGTRSFRVQFLASQVTLDAARAPASKTG